MKKVFLFLALVIVIGVKAQTFEKTKSLAQKELNGLSKEVSQINERIYYLKVTLPEKIVRDSALRVSGKKYLLEGSNLDALRKEKCFAEEEIKTLNFKKLLLQKQIDDLLLVINYSTTSKIEKDLQSDLPETMGVYEYRRRNRALNFKVGEKIADQGYSNVPSGEYGVGLPGILFNGKFGRGEVASFTFTNKHHPEFGVFGPYCLNPQDSLRVNLMPGTYLVRIVCGSVDVTVEMPPVDPRNVKSFLGKKCYFYAQKLKSDY